MKRSMLLTLATIATAVFLVPATPARVAEACQVLTLSLAEIAGDLDGADPDPYITDNGESLHDCGDKKCGSHWWQSWKVKGEYVQGSGTVEFAKVCGGADLISCHATPNKISCETDYRNPIDEPSDCVARILDGNPGGISGKCIDPYNPNNLQVARIVDLRPGTVGPPPGPGEAARRALW